MIPKIKDIIVFVVIAIIVIFIYIFWNKKGPEQAPLVSIPSSTSPTDLILDKNSSLSQDFLSVLLNVRNIKLNGAIFNDPAFTSLSDSSILLTPDNTEGRPNPFAPLGSDATTSNTLTTTPSTTTPSTTTPSTTTPSGGVMLPTVNDNKAPTGQ